MGIALTRNVKIGLALGALGLVVGSLLAWGAWGRQQLAMLGCPPTCCGAVPSCTSYYYTEAFRRDTEAIYDRALTALAPKSGERFADVGAGWGAVALRLAPSVGPEGRVWATDLDRSRLAEIDLRAKAAGLQQLQTIAVTDPWAIGLGAEAGPLDGLVFLNSVNFKREQDLGQIVAYLKAWRNLLGPGARVVYHTDWIDKWLLGEDEIRGVFASAGYGQAESLPLPAGLQGETCYCPADGGPQHVRAGYLLRWTLTRTAQ